MCYSESGGHRRHRQGRVPGHRRVLADHEQRALLVLCCSCLIKVERFHGCNWTALPAQYGYSCCLVTAQLRCNRIQTACEATATASANMHVQRIVVGSVLCAVQYWGAAWELAQAPQGPLNLRVTDDKGNQVSARRHRMPSWSEAVKRPRLRDAWTRLLTGVPAAKMLHCLLSAPHTII